MENTETVLNNRFLCNFSHQNHLGKGNFAEVYRGTDTHTKTEVAIKKINKVELFGEDSDDYYRKAFEKEITILKMIKCKYSIELIDTFEEDEYTYLILELCDMDLEKYFKKRKTPFTVDEVRKIMNQLNQVLYIMYTKKIMHRDLKTENILIKYTNASKSEFDIKLADYGFSTIAKNNIAYTEVGTPRTMAPEVLNGREYTNKADLWSVGVIIYYLVFKKYPFVARNKQLLKEVMRTREPEYKTNDVLLVDLLKRLFKKNEKERMTWEEYFQHEFFGNGKITVTPSSTEDWTGVHIAANKNSKQVNSRYEFDIGDKINCVNKNNDYVCYRVKERNKNETYIIKQYSTAFTKANGGKLEKEIEIFKQLNEINVPCLKYKETQLERGLTTTLIFENLKDVIVLSEYIQTKHLSEQMLYNLITGLIKDIFVPMNKLNIVLPLITLDSILIDKKTGKPYLFECGLLRYLYEDSYVNKYYIYDAERSSVINEKTNVLNFGVTIFEAYYRRRPRTQQNSKEIDLPQGIDSSDELKELLSHALYRKSENRATWAQLADMMYVREPLKLCSRNQNLFETHSVNHIYTSFICKSNIFKSFINTSRFYKQLAQSPKLVEFIWFFLFCNIAELDFAKKLFTQFTKRESKLPFYMTVFNINESNPVSMNPDSEYLNFGIIPESHRLCSKEVLDKLNSMPPELEKVRMDMLDLFRQVGNKLPMSCGRKKWKELLVETVKYLKSEKMFMCVHEIINRMRNNANNNKDDVVFVKFILEFVIMFCELTLKKQKLLENSFHEINAMYVDSERNNSLQISVIEPNTNKNELNRTVFTSFLKTGLEEIKNNFTISEQEKIKLKKPYKIFVQDYMDIVKQLK